MSKQCYRQINIKVACMSWPAHVVVLDKGFLHFAQWSSPLSKFKVFSASKSSMVRFRFIKRVPQAVDSIFDSTLLA